MYPEQYESEFDNIPLTVLEHFDWSNNCESEYEELDGFRVYSKPMMCVFN